MIKRTCPLTVMVISITLVFAASAPLLLAQTFTVLHTFGNGTDGYEPLSGVAIDTFGNLYGTTAFGGDEFGIAYKLAPRGSGWVYSVLHIFGGDDGFVPIAKPLIAPNGTLYGTATLGGIGQHGTLYNLKPPAARCPAVPCHWTATVLHSFSYSSDGGTPYAISYDQAGNIIGVASAGGPEGVGTVYRMTQAHGAWTFSLVTDFHTSRAGSPFGQVVADQAGNVYGTGYDTYPGTVFEVTPTGQAQVLHQFSFTDGLDPYYGLVRDSNGNLYGLTAFGGGNGDGGTVYEMSPSGGGGFSFNLLYSFAGIINNGTLGSASMTMDSHGNLYGTTFGNGAYNYGQVFKLSPSPNGWIYTDLHDFTGGDDGCYPWSDVVMDSAGNLYGTASQCGSVEYPPTGGTVWEITP